MTFGSEVTIYDFDDVNRLQSITDNTNGVYSFAYDNLNRMTTRVMPNGVSTTTDYDGMGRMKFWKNQASGGGVLNEFIYSYNTANQITQITEPSKTRTFGYDNADRLTSSTSTVSGQNESYTFDDVGNRTSSHLSSVYGYQSGSFNRLSSTQQASYSFDNNGNLTSKTEGTAKWYYSYDRENRLTNAAKFGGMMPRANESVNYQYDAFGRRVVRQDKKSGRTEFTHDGMDVIQDRFEKNDGSTSTTNYVNGLGIDDKLKITTGTTSKYFLTDHLGSTVGMADTNGNVTESASYDSFGRTISSNLTTRYQYTGRETDEKTGLIYYRARQYDPQIGRFTSEDPIGFEGGDVNLYGYVWNNPQHFTDPSGLDVSAYYDRRKKRLVVYNNDIPPKIEYVQNPNPTDINQPVGYQEIRYDRHVFDEGIFSGDGDCQNELSCELVPFDGPIPSGEYAIGDDFKGRGWYWLRRKQPDGTYSDFAKIDNTGVSRGNFRLHLGRISYGCLTFSYSQRDAFKKIDDILKITSKTPVTYSDDPKNPAKSRSYGVLTVY